MFLAELDTSNGRRYDCSRENKETPAVRFCLVWIVANVPLYTKRFNLIGCFNTPILSQPAEVGNRLSSYASHSASFDQDFTIQRTGWTRESAYYVTDLDAHSVIFPRAQLFRPGNAETKLITFYDELPNLVPKSEVRIH